MFDQKVDMNGCKSVAKKEKVCHKVSRFGWFLVGSRRERTSCGCLDLEYLLHSEFNLPTDDKGGTSCFTFTARAKLRWTNETAWLIKPVFLSQKQLRCGEVGKTELRVTGKPNERVPSLRIHCRMLPFAGTDVLLHLWEGSLNYEEQSYWKEGTLGAKHQPSNSSFVTTGHFRPVDKMSRHMASDAWRHVSEPDC